jgi:hypothetical protein
MKEWRTKNPDYMNNYRHNKTRKKELIHRHGLTEEEYNKLTINVTCEICEHEMGTPCVDHDHKTGKVRGVLCRECNSALGLFMDDPDILRKAIDYLERSRGRYEHEEGTDN